MAENKKIYLFIRTFSEYGGVEKTCLRFYLFLKNRKYDVRVICGENKSDIANDDIQETGLWRPGRFLKTLSFYLKSKRILSKIDSKYTFSFGKVAGCKIYRTGGGSHRSYLKISIKGFDKKSKKIKKIISRALSPVNYLNPYLEKKIYRNISTKYFIAISSFVAEEIISDFGINPSKVKVVNNSVDRDKFNLDLKQKYRPALRNDLKIKESDILLGFCSTNFQLKGLDNLLRALALLDSGFHLAVAGGRKNDKYIDLIKKLKIEKRVHFLGKVKNMARFYAGLDVLVHPSYYDTFGNVISEALAMNVPVALSKRTGAKDIVENGKNGIIMENLKPKTIADSIIKATKIERPGENSNLIHTDEDVFQKYLELLFS